MSVMDPVAGERCGEIGFVLHDQSRVVGLDLVRDDGGPGFDYVAREVDELSAFANFVADLVEARYVTTDSDRSNGGNHVDD